MLATRGLGPSRLLVTSGLGPVALSAVVVLPTGGSAGSDWRNTQPRMRRKLQHAPPLNDDDEVLLLLVI